MVSKFMAQIQITGKTRADSDNNARQVVCNFVSRCRVWMACVLLLELTACVQLPEVQVKKEEQVLLVYPLPPDDARFVYERTIRNRSV